MRRFCFSLLFVLGFRVLLVAAEPSGALPQGTSSWIQAEVRRLVAACRGNKHPPEQLIRRMLTAYTQVASVSELTPTRRQELQNILARRMLEQARRMVRQLKRGKRPFGRSASLVGVSYRGGEVAVPARSAPGGGAVLEQDQARQLIELIQRTICPDSWAVNGGRGTIYYFAPAHALVVRQRGEIHRELQGLLRQLRR